MSLANPAANPLDSWDYSVDPRARPATVRKVEHIPDDWDNDDDDEDEEEEPQKLWETANNQAPMPEVVVSHNISSSVVSPPPAAFQPTLRILKRPSPSASPSSAHSSASASDLQKSYAEREAQYQAARDRIFGGGTPPSSSSDLKPPSRKGSPTPLSSVTSVAIIRQPRGPDSPLLESQTSAQPHGPNTKAFRGRRGGKARSTNSAPRPS